MSAENPRLPAATYRFTLIPLVGLTAFLFTVAWSTAAQEPGKPRGSVVADLDGFRNTVVPFLAAHCTRCHGVEKQKGKLALHALDGDVPNGKDIDKWKHVAERLTLNEMPPDSEPRPDAQATAKVLAWIKAELAKGGESTADAERHLLLPGNGNRVDHAALFTGPTAGPAASPARLWRMSPQIYTRFIPRIAGQKKGTQSTKIAQPFSTSSAEGFKDFADLFTVDEPTVSQLLRNAQQVVLMQTNKSAQGKLVKEFLPLVDSNRKPTLDEARAAIRKQFELALQRRPSEEELGRFLALLDKNVADAGQVIGARDMLATILMLPEAMYRLELGTGTADAHGRRMLAPRELAYAIAFALNDEGPDSTLLKAAESGRLATRDDVCREVQRLLNAKDTEKARVLRFFEEYFEYPEALEVFKDLQRGQWRPEILVNDTRYLIQHVLDRDQNVLKELLTTNKSFVNYRVDAKGVAGPARITNKQGKNQKGLQLEYHDLYNLPENWKWTDQQPVELPREQRAGILTQPSWLAAFATNNENHAIRRGKWVRERLLGGVVPDLPITVDAQLPDKPEQTLRQRMAINQQEYCWQCHQKMNPLGLAFESYDYLGRFRTTETVADLKAAPVKAKAKAPATPATREVPLDTTGRIEYSGDPTLDGPVANAVELIHKLAESPRVRQVFVRHAFRFWMGRNETLADATTLRAADQAYLASGGSMKALITALLTSDSFLYRTVSPNK